MTKALTLSGYRTFLAALKERILQARTSAARAVNRDLILLYWDIGRGIVEKQLKAGWGDAVVERLAADLRAEFPDMRGFSARNLWDMKRMWLAYSDREFWRQAVAILDAGSSPDVFLRQLVAEIPWGHHANVREGNPIWRQPVAEIEPEHAGTLGFDVLKTKTHPIGVAEYQLRHTLPAELKGRLPSAKQLADAIREILPERK